MADINGTLDQRAALYGNFLRQASIACDLKGIMRSHIDWTEQLAPDQREALEMICVKLARIVNGNPNYADSWVDIAGYAQLVANRLMDKDG